MPIVSMDKGDRWGPPGHCTSGTISALSGSRLNGLLHYRNGKGEPHQLSHSRVLIRKPLPIEGCRDIPHTSDSAASCWLARNAVQTPGLSMPTFPCPTCLYGTVPARVLLGTFSALETRGMCLTGFRATPRRSVESTGKGPLSEARTPIVEVHNHYTK